MSLSASSPRPSVRLVRLAALLTTFSLALLTLAGVATRPADAATSAPKGLHVTATATTSVSVSWSKVSKAGGYKVKYSRSTKMTKPTYVRTTKTSASLKGLKAGTTYYVKVRATKKSGKKLSGYSKVVKVTTHAAGSGSSGSGGNPDLRVGSYNVTCEACYDGQPNELHWYGRAATVAASIRAQKLDVIGVQEASQSKIADASGKQTDVTQFDDLRNRLGGSWELVNDKRFNCKKASSSKNCDYVDQGASDGTRIYYDSAKVAVANSGSKLLPTVKGVNNRYVAWAELEQLSTGKHFMFATTQLEHTKDKGAAGVMFKLRQDQAQTIVDTVKAHNPHHLPALVVGDLNSSRFPHDYSPSNGPYDVLVDHGYVDPLGAAWKSTKSTKGELVEHRINTWLDSFNGFARTDVGHPGWVNGSYIDYILVQPTMEVKEWETVANLDSNGNLAGIVPSDHNMIRATVVLP